VGSLIVTLGARLCFGAISITLVVCYLSSFPKLVIVLHHQYNYIRLISFFHYCYILLSYFPFTDPSEHTDNFSIIFSFCYRARCLTLHQLFLKKQLLRKKLMIKPQNDCFLMWVHPFCRSDTESFLFTHIKICKVDTCVTDENNWMGNIIGMGRWISIKFYWFGRLLNYEVSRWEGELWQRA
jgi:hypothetical protein